jgi:hypothetical protein
MLDVNSGNGAIGNDYKGCENPERLSEWLVTF